LALGILIHHNNFLLTNEMISEKLFILFVFTALYEKVIYYICIYIYIYTATQLRKFIKRDEEFHKVDNDYL
jgi:hypothetical protein